MINIANGVVASENVNCYKAFELGLDAACNVNDIRFSEVKLSKKDKVIMMSSTMNILKCRDKVVEINPLLLFHRICCVIDNREEYLMFELTQQPPV